MPRILIKPLHLIKVFIPVPDESDDGPVKTKIHCCIHHEWRTTLTAGLAFYCLTCLCGAGIMGWRLWMMFPVTMSLVALGITMLPRLLTAGLIRAGVLAQGFYCDKRKRRITIHLASWTPLSSLTCPSAGRETRESLLISLRSATRQLAEGHADEIVMASWMLTPRRIRRTLLQAGIDRTQYCIRTGCWHAGVFRRYLLQCVLLLTQWRWQSLPGKGAQVRISLPQKGEQAVKTNNLTERK